MDRVSGWELRQRAEERTGHAVSCPQLQEYIEVGLLPDRAEDGWLPTDVERLVRIWELGKEVRPLHRRVVFLRDLRWPTPPAKLRAAMIATVPSLNAAITKMRQLHRAVRLQSGDVTPAAVHRLGLPPAWRPPAPAAWQALFRWPADEPDRSRADAEFEQLAASVYNQGHALLSHPGVQKAGLLAEIPFDHLVILLMTRQFSIGSELQALALHPEREEVRP